MSNINWNNPLIQRQMQLEIIKMASWNNIPISKPIRLVVEKYYNNRLVEIATSFVSVDELTSDIEQAMEQTDCDISCEEGCIVKVVRGSTLYKKYIARYYDESSEIAKIQEDIVK